MLENLLPSLLMWLLAGGFSPFIFGPLHKAILNIEAAFLQNGQSKSERATKTEAAVTFMT